MSDKHMTASEFPVQVGEEKGIFRCYIPVHVYPVSSVTEHRLDGWCWCQPLVEDVLGTDGRLYIHRRSLDSPHIETDP